MDFGYTYHATKLVIRRLTLSARPVEYDFNLQGLADIFVCVDENELPNYKKKIIAVFYMSTVTFMPYQRLN